MNDEKAIHKLRRMCEFSCELEDGFCTDISFHTEDDAFGGTIRRHPHKDEIVGVVSNFPRLRRLNFRRCKIGYVPNLRSQEVEYLDMSCNDITTVPEKVLEDQPLRFLNLGANNLAELPDLSHLPLETLKLHKNVELKSLPLIPKGIKSMNLFLLCKMTRIPEVVFDLPLEVFSFGVTKLDHLPSLSRLSQLRWLTLTVNQFDKLPDDICSLSKLEGLWLAKNKLKSLPDRMGDMNLKTLTVYGNNIEKLPDSFFQLKLQKLNVARNPLSNMQRVIDSFSHIEFLRTA